MRHHNLTEEAHDNGIVGSSVDPTVGFDFERSAMRHFLHLSRLTLAVCLLYTWFLVFGTHLVHVGLLIGLTVAT